MPDGLDRFRREGWNIPPTAAMKRARLANGGGNKTCPECGLMNHPIRTECSRCATPLAEVAASTEGDR